MLDLYTWDPNAFIKTVAGRQIAADHMQSASLLLRYDDRPLD